MATFDEFERSLLQQWGRDDTMTSEQWLREWLLYQRTIAAYLTRSRYLMGLPISPAVVLLSKMRAAGYKPNEDTG